MVWVNVQPETRTSPAKLAEDLRLIRAALGGDANARAQFVERMRCIPRLIAIRSRATGLTAEDRADLAQEIFAEVWRRLPDYRGEAPIEAWVHSFCARALANAKRKHLRRGPMAPLEADGGEAAAPPTEDPRLDELRRGLARLGPDDAAVIRLHCMQSLPHEVVGQRLGCTARAARARYERAMGRLRGALAELTQGGSK